MLDAKCTKNRLHLFRIVIACFTICVDYYLYSGLLNWVPFNRTCSYTYLLPHDCDVNKYTVWTLNRRRD
jgi:hypothetical protein